MTNGDAQIPSWAADLRVTVAEIKGMANQIPVLQTSIEAVRAAQIPAGEYSELTRKVGVLWTQYEQAEGRRLGRLAWRGLVTVVGGVVGILFTLKELGVSINIH